MEGKYIPFNDGFGIVGYGYECPKCKHETKFTSCSDGCEKCGYKEDKYVDPDDWYDNEWLCEDHPEEEMGHGGCNGAGIPKEAQVFMLVVQRRNAIQKYKNCKWFYEDLIYGLVKRIKELENVI